MINAEQEKRSDRELISNLQVLGAIQQEESSRELKGELGDVDKAGCSSTTTDDVQPSTEEEDFYHGLIPKEDLPFILRKVGDFVTRTTVSGDKVNVRVLVLSVKTLSGKSQTAFRHVVIRMNKTEKKVEWRAFENIAFGSLKELIDYYITNERPILPHVRESVLVQGVKHQSWEFNNKDVKLTRFLGTGQFGDVHAGEVLIGGRLRKVAIKLGKKDTEGQKLSKEQMKSMMNESRLMRHFNHENVLRTFGVAVMKEPVMIVLELVKGGCILDVVHTRRGHVSEGEKMGQMSLGTAKGLAYIHEHKCIHRDIAARNVLYTHDKIAKISDFGMSRMGDSYHVTSRKRIPLRWTGPEGFTVFKYTTKSDVFSFAIFMWEVLSDGQEPYKDITNIEVRRMVGKGQRMEKPKGCSIEAFNIVAKCWAQNPEERCSMKEAVELLKTLSSKQDTEHSTEKDSTNSENALCERLAKSNKRVRRRRTRRNEDSGIGNNERHPRLSSLMSIKVIRPPRTRNVKDHERMVGETKRSTGDYKEAVAGSAKVNATMTIATDNKSAG